MTNGDGHFIRYLYRLASDERSDNKDAADARAALATLRRGRGKEPGTVAEMYSRVVPALREAKPWEQQSWVDATYFLIASLFAGHRWSRQNIVEESFKESPSNLGASFLAFERAAEVDGQAVSASTEKRFAALLECDRGEMPDHLRYAVNLLDDTPIDWATLLDDLLRWDEEKRAQLRWAKAYWYRPSKKPTDDDSTAGQTNDDDNDDDDGVEALAKEGV